MLILLLILMPLLMPLAAEAQWDQVVMLSRDSLEHGGGQLLVDDSLRLHTLDIRISHASSPQTSSLYYQRFDSWGNALCLPQEIFPADTHWIDWAVGALLDRQQNIHVVWTRVYDQLPDFLRTYYVRLNTQGEVLTPPIELTAPDEPFGFHCCIDMVEDSSGIIWVEGFSLVATISEEGEILTPFEYFVMPPEAVDASMLAVGTTGEVWTAYRHTDSTGQSVRIMRLDTTALEPEVVIDDLGIQGVQCNVEAFYIDTTNAFHYMLYRDVDGVFYQRDPRNGGTTDTLVVDLSPWGNGTTNFTCIGGDTLLWLWGQSEPEIGINRVAVRINGERAYGPVLVPTVHFTLASRYRFTWKRGSTWIVGGGGDGTTPYGQLAMIHVPGSEEPPNGISPQAGQPVLPNPAISIYPQPANDQLLLLLPPDCQRSYEIKVFNVLGEQISISVAYNPAGSARILLPGGLPSGSYYLQLRSPRGVAAKHFTILK